MTFQALIYAFLGGLLPALLWLWFWRKEDKERPEPRGLILLTFFAGMIAVPLALPLECFVDRMFNFGLSLSESAQECLTLPEGLKKNGEIALAAMIGWATVEEILKFLAAYVTALRSRFLDEPVDGLIYLITAALGFSALENAFFLIKPLVGGKFFESILTGNFRFMGATLVHTVSSAAIGAAIAISFYRHGTIKIIYIVFGLFTGITLHALFNFSIMKTVPQQIFLVFGGVWAAAALLLLFFEYAKKIKVTRNE